VKQLQNQNNKLLREHARLTTTVEDLEQKLRTDPNIAKLAAAEEELEVLRADRERQETMVASIVQQRDMLRVMAGTGGDVSSTDLVAVDKTAEQFGVLQKRSRSLEEELSKARAELSKLGTDKMVLEERVVRYSETNKELQSSLDKVTRDITTKDAAVRTSEARAEHHKRTVATLEDELASAQGEIKRKTENLSNAHNNIRDLEQQMIAAKAQANRSDYDAREANSKLRLAETQLQTARAAEQRYATEAAQLRSDLNRQGNMIDSVQRIEARLSARGEEEKERLLEESKRVAKLLEAERIKSSQARATLEERTKDLEASTKAAKEKEASSVAEALSAKKKAVEAVDELQTFKVKCERLEKDLASEKQKTTGSANETEASKIESLTQQLDAARAEVGKAKARMADFQKIAKSSEDSLKDLTKTSEEFKKTHDDEIASLNRRIASLKKESKAKESVVTELTQDLSGQRGEQDKAVKALKSQIDGMKDGVVTAEKEKMAAVARAESLQADAEKYQKEAAVAQSNYDRELNLHATARAELRTAREAASEADRLRKTTVHEMEMTKREIESNQQALADEKAGLERTITELQKRIEESSQHNDKLHAQLATLGEQIEKSQSEQIDSGATEVGDEGEIGVLRKSVAEYREIVRFLRSERDMDRAQLETAKRTADRERATAEVTKRSLDEARAELNVSQARGGKTTETDMAAFDVKLKEAEAQLNVVSESNQLLRVEAGQLKKTVSQLETKLAEAKGAIAPKDKLALHLEGKVASMQAEKDSLSRELESWKRRVESLVAKFNHVDPEDHKKALADAQSMKKERDVAKAEKATAHRTNVALKQQIAKLNKDVSTNQSLIEKQKAQLAKARADSDVAAASTRGSAVVSKERDMLKEKLQKTEVQNRSLATELKGVNERNERLKERMRQFQKMLNEKKAMIAKLESEKVAVTTSSAPTASDSAGGSTVAPAPATASMKPPPTQTVSKTMKPQQAEAAKEPTQKSKAEPQPNVDPEANPDQQKKTEAQLPAVPKGGFAFGPGPVKSRVEAAAKSTVASSKKSSSTKRGAPEPSTKTETKSSVQSSGATQSAEAPAQPAQKKPRMATSGSVSPKPGAAKVENPAEQKVKADQLRAKLLEAKMKKKRAIEKKNEEVRVAKQAKVDEEKAASGRKEDGADAKGKPLEEKQTGDEGKPSSSSSEPKANLRASATPFQPPLGAAKTGTGAFGSGTHAAFGSSTSIGSSGFGGIKPASGAAESVFGFKPPGTSSGPLSFGAAAVSKLPMPAAGTPSIASPFGAFEGSNPFGAASASGAKPLFGSSSNVKPISTATSAEQKTKAATEEPRAKVDNDDDSASAS